MTAPKRVLFITGTRADFGKTRPLMQAVDEADDFECTIFVSGMHTLGLHGWTVNEVHKAGFKNIHVFMNQILGEPMDLVLVNTIGGLSRFVHEAEPDLLVVHGDRVETLAGAIVGALRNVRVGHIEGGELSGTVDELIRHAVSKLSHLHFVANDEAAGRLRQLGKIPASIFVIGSPDLDVMGSPNLPSVESVKEYYGIEFDRFGLAMFHPVMSELEGLGDHTAAFVDALAESGHSFVVIHPNNDEGAESIRHELARLDRNPGIRTFPSLRFESFLTLMKHADLIVGNSSAGIREAPYYGLPTVNIGTRQQNRFHYQSIVNTGYGKDEVLAAILAALKTDRFPPSTHVGTGNSREAFMEVIRKSGTWEIPKQKQFVDLAAALERASGWPPCSSPSLRRGAVPRGFRARTSRILPASRSSPTASWRQPSALASTGSW